MDFDVYRRAALDAILAHEGGLVNHPQDPGGWTNKGVTIGTLKRLGIDVDGDGDSDLADLKALSDDDARGVFRRFYWDAVQADLLPVGLGYAVADFAVNSGAARAAKTLQAIVDVEQDGVIGPKTVAAVNELDPLALVHALCDRRLAFLRGLSGWQTFGRGWESRVDGVRRQAAAWARAATQSPVEPCAALRGQVRAAIAELRRIAAQLEAEA